MTKNAKANSRFSQLCLVRVYTTVHMFIGSYDRHLSTDRKAEKPFRCENLLSNKTSELFDYDDGYFSQNTSHEIQEFFQKWRNNFSYNKVNITGNLSS